MPFETPYLIPADVCVPKLRSNSAHPLSSIKTCHYQAQLLETCTPYGAGVPLYLPHSRVRAAYKAAPTAANADGIAGLIEKSNNANIPTIPSEIVKAVSIEPIINFTSFDLTGTFSTSLSIIILRLPVLYWP